MNKTVGKWNYLKHEYDPYSLPDGATTIAGLDEVVACADCGKKVIFGDTYTSMEIHNHFGMGYAVCPKCYEKEWVRREENERINDQCE